MASKGFEFLLFVLELFGRESLRDNKAIESILEDFSKRVGIKGWNDFLSWGVGASFRGWCSPDIVLIIWMHLDILDKVHFGLRDDIL